MNHRGRGKGEIDTTTESPSTAAEEQLAWRSVPPWVRPQAAAFSALLAGVIWLLVWGHGQVAHGQTQVNEMDKVLGLTWMDSGKFLVLSFLLLIPGIVFVTRSAGDRGSNIAVMTGWVIVVLLSVAAVATALQFWTFEWGSYAETFESKRGAATIGGVVQALSSAVLLSLSLVVFGVATGRRGVMPYVISLVLVAGSLGTVFLGPPFPIPGIAWLLFGAWLLVKARTGRPGVQ